MHTSLPEGIVWLMIILPLCGTEIVFSKPEHFIQTYWVFFCCQIQEMQAYHVLLNVLCFIIQKKNKTFLLLCPSNNIYTHLPLVVFSFPSGCLRICFSREFSILYWIQCKDSDVYFFILPHMAFK